MSPRRNNWQRAACGIAVLLLTALPVLARETSVEELKAKLKNATHADEKASLAVQVAERQVEAADQLYKAGKTDEAQQAVSDVTSYSQQACDAALVTGHRVKNVEIAVRKMAHRLTDMKRQLTFEDQAPVQTAIDQLEKIRTDLLNRMFKAGK